MVCLKIVGMYAYTVAVVCLIGLTLVAFFHAPVQNDTYDVFLGWVVFGVFGLLIVGFVLGLLGVGLDSD